MNVSLNGFAEAILTLKMEENAAKGAPVSIRANLTAAPSGADESFAGFLAAAPKGGCAAVQVAGYIEAPYSGTAPALGYAALAADGGGKLKTASSGPMRLVLKVDETNKTVGFLL